MKNPMMRKKLTLQNMMWLKMLQILTCIHLFRCQKWIKNFVNQIKMIKHVEEQHVQKEKVRQDILYPEKCRHCEKFINTRRDMEFHYLDIYTCVNSLSE